MKPLGFAVVIIVVAWVFFFLGRAYQQYRIHKEDLRQMDKQDQEDWEQEVWKHKEAKFRKENWNKSVKP